MARVKGGNVNIHSVTVSYQGKNVAETYFRGSDRTIYSMWGTTRNLGPHDLHDMRSVSKSLVALAYGILLERGEVPSLDTRIASLYPEYKNAFEPPKDAIRVRDLLTMASGLDWNEPSPVKKTWKDDQIGLIWRSETVPFVFGREAMANPGDAFVYSGGLTSVLADVMARATGRDLADIVGKEIFIPMGITEWSWSKDLRGRPISFAGLRLSPHALQRIGEMVLNRGQWQGRQIVPAKWIDEATATQIVASTKYGYGFQWWTSTLAANGATLTVKEAVGNGGQRIYVVPDLQLVVTMTAGEYGTLEIFASEDQIFEAIVRAIPRGNPSITSR
jgi:CubicO group peptidase (beta-lactamase class C family)